jgi:hypothetical protein
MTKKIIQKPDDDKVFEIIKDPKNLIFSTPDQKKNFRASRYETGVGLESKFSTPIDGSKRYSLDPNHSSPYNHYSFSSSEAMWKLRMKASNNGIIPYDRGYLDKKSSISPVRLKDDFINIESIKKQIKARQNIIKSTGKLQTNSKSDIRSERQISDPKKLLDEFMLPHATIMA